MALPGSGVVNQGLQRIGRNLAVVGGGAAVGASQTVTRYLMTMSVDDSASNFAAADTTLQTSRTAPTNEFDQLLDGLATIAAQTISFTCTLGTASANFTIRGIAWHDDVVATVTATSANLTPGTPRPSLHKTASSRTAATPQL